MPNILIKEHLIQKLFSRHSDTHWINCSTRTTKVVSQTDQHPFNGLFSRTTWVSQHQKGKKPLWILMKQEMMGWQWH